MITMHVHSNENPTFAVRKLGGNGDDSRTFVSMDIVTENGSRVSFFVSADDASLFDLQSLVHDLGDQIMELINTPAEV